MSRYFKNDSYTYSLDKIKQHIDLLSKTEQASINKILQCLSNKTKLTQSQHKFVANTCRRVNHLLIAKQAKPAL